MSQSLIGIARCCSCGIDVVALRSLAFGMPIAAVASDFLVSISLVELLALCLVNISVGSPGS